MTDGRAEKLARALTRALGFKVTSELDRHYDAAALAAVDADPAAYGYARLNAEWVDEADRNWTEQPWHCPRCQSARWVAVSFNGGHTRVRQCVPCGKVDEAATP